MSHEQVGFVKTWIELAKVDSTNDHARSLIEANPTIELPLLVIAREQTNGRGQGTNLWWSDRGSLTLTLAIDPRACGLSTEQEPLVALTTAVAILDAIGPYVPPVYALGIRWPNDIEADSRKLGGILSEPLIVGGRVFLLIGVGLNVHTKLDLAPRAIRKMAVSLSEFGTVPELERVLDRLLPQIENAINALGNGDPALPERWREADLLLDRLITVDLAGRGIVGIGQGIDEKGALRMATETGTETFHAGRVLRD